MGFWEKLFKDVGESDELKVRRHTVNEQIQYDRIQRTGSNHEHNFVKVDPIQGSVTEGTAYAYYDRKSTFEAAPQRAACPNCGGFH